MNTPQVPHFNSLKRIIRYLQGTLELGLHIYHSRPTRLIAYINVNWVSCPDTRRSTFGYCVFLKDNLIVRSAKRQPTLSQPSVEAKYRVVTEICWLRNFFMSFM